MAVLPRVENVTSQTTDKVDTYILYAVAEGAPVEFKFGINSRKVTGIAKVAAIVLKKLFTEVGSNPLNRFEGTEMATLLGSNIGDEEEALLLIQEALRDAKEQVINEQINQNLASDEQLLSLTLVTYEFVTADSIDIWINLVTVAGTSATVKLPKVDFS